MSMVSSHYQKTLVSIKFNRVLGIEPSPDGFEWRNLKKLCYV
jgi:hypothetical protein